MPKDCIIGLETYYSICFLCIKKVIFKISTINYSFKGILIYFKRFRFFAFKFLIF